MTSTALHSPAAVQSVDFSSLRSVKRPRGRPEASGLPGAGFMPHIVNDVLAKLVWFYQNSTRALCGKKEEENAREKELNDLFKIAVVQLKVHVVNPVVNAFTNLKSVRNNNLRYNIISRLMKCLRLAFVTCFLRPTFSAIKGRSKGYQRLSVPPKFDDYCFLHLKICARNLAHYHNVCQNVIVANTKDITVGLGV
ncbi:hypothetical protein L2E82_25995 [Cichorium intybus]|uniref:Uncharacterized protein n=1 Tax=Cichorium intybus TaxID=13427 RepID=A0ACB9E516_CICIN|nr:hypothetical protein L2E82_25995 [Cichorium intybus]